MISVIMPAYNVEKYIGDSIKSVLTQTYQDIELLIVNDGSQDKTKQIIQSYQEQDSRIKYFEQENQGVSVARNLGISKATGEYISFLDADDLWAEDALAKMYQHMLTQIDCKFVYGRTQEKLLSGETQVVGPEGAIDGYLEDFIYKTNELRLRSHMSALLIERKLLNDCAVHFPPGIKISEDTYFMIQLLCVTKARGIDDIVAFYLRREASATTSQWRPERWRGHVTIYQLLTEYVQRYRPEAVTAFFRMRNYVAYRFVLSCLRHGFVKEAQQDIAAWQCFLQEFCCGNGKLTDRLKCKALLYFAKSESMLLKLAKL